MYILAHFHTGTPMITPTSIPPNSFELVMLSLLACCLAFITISTSIIILALKFSQQRRRIYPFRLNRLVRCDNIDEIPVSDYLPITKYCNYTMVMSVHVMLHV